MRTLKVTTQFKKDLKKYQNQNLLLMILKQKLKMTYQKKFQFLQKLQKIQSLLILQKIILLTLFQRKITQFLLEKQKHLKF